MNAASAYLEGSSCTCASAYFEAGGSLAALVARIEEVVQGELLDNLPEEDNLRPRIQERLQRAVTYLEKRGFAEENFFTSLWRKVWGVPSEKEAMVRAKEFAEVLKDKEFSSDKWGVAGGWVEVQKDMSQKNKTGFL